MQSRYEGFCWRPPSHCVANAHSVATMSPSSHWGPDTDKFHLVEAQHHHHWGDALPSQQVTDELGNTYIHKKPKSPFTHRNQHITCFSHIILEMLINYYCALPVGNIHWNNWLIIAPGSDVCVGLELGSVLPLHHLDRCSHCLSWQVRRGRRQCLQKVADKAWTGWGDKFRDIIISQYLYIYSIWICICKYENREQIATAR